MPNTDRHIPFTQADVNAIGLHEVSRPTGDASHLDGSHIYQVGASFYGGPNDPSTPGTHGYKGDELDGTMAYAELKMGTAMGGLPYRTKLVIEYNGKTVTGTKLDIGAGGSNVDGLPRVIDLWWQTAEALGFKGTGVVTIYRDDGKPMNIPGATVGNVSGPGGVAGALDNAAVDAGNAVSATATLAEKVSSLFFTQAGWVRLLKLFAGVTIGLIAIKNIFNVNMPLPVPEV